jgi:hypothetical protein
MSRPILLYKLTPAQIELVERLAASEHGLLMDDLEYREIVTYQELARLGFADMMVGSRRRAAIVLTDQGRQVRDNGYFSKKPVIRVTDPQVQLLRFLAGCTDGTVFNQIPSTMIDVCRRMALRGWVEWRERRPEDRRAHLTPEGQQILMLIDA